MAMVVANVDEECVVVEEVATADFRRCHGGFVFNLGCGNGPAEVVENAEFGTRICFQRVESL